MPANAALLELVREAKEEGAKASEVSKATRLTYEAKAKQLAKGWDMGPACKNSRYSMRAAGLWTMRRQLRALVKEAERARKKGLNGVELFTVREAQFAHKMEAVRSKLIAIREFEALPWTEIDDPGRRLQSPHKQKAATDSELLEFFEAAAKSSYREAFLVAEFSGCRGEEFREGIRVEIGKKGGSATMRFFTQSAKTDGDKKGLDLRAVDVPFPSGASKAVQRRWMELAKSVQASKKGHVVKIEPTAKSTAGQLFTRACADTAKKANIDMAAYSLRHRFSAQVKQANPGDAVAVALALGHQTTETQRHYARAKRGGGDVSPVQIEALNVSGQKIRGAPKREGPRIQTKTKIALAAAVPTAGRSPSGASLAQRSKGPRL